MRPLRVVLVAALLLVALAAVKALNPPWPWLCSGWPRRMALPETKANTSADTSVSVPPPLSFAPAPLTAQDSATILKMAKGLALPGGSLRASISRVRGNTVTVFVQTETKDHGDIDVSTYEMAAVRQADGQWRFLDLIPHMSATLVPFEALPAAVQAQIRAQRKP